VLVAYLMDSIHRARLAFPCYRFFSDPAPPLSVREDVKIWALLQSPCIKILLLVYSKGEVRHSELESLIRSRGTLSSNLNDLLDEGLLKRNIIASRPIQSNYSLTERGKAVTKILTDLKNSLRPT